MSEWGTTPDYIVNHWSEELLTLMVEKLVERKRIEHGKPSQRVSDTELFAQAGNLIKVEKND